MLIEAMFPLAMCGLYVWEVHGGLRRGVAHDAAELHAEFWSHYAIMTLMVVATFIDFDEKTIPDAVTIPGTLMGMTFAALLPSSWLPAGTMSAWLTAPNDWSPSLNGWAGLALGMTCVTSWCLALLPRTLWFRSGFLRGLQFLLASMVRHGLSKWIGLIWIVSSFAITAVWIVQFRQGQEFGGMAWQGLLSSLVGIAGGGGLVWAIRISASTAMGREALGFGDVTLMAMIGSFFGWQFATFAFFAAPFAGMIIAVAQLVLTRDREIAFGPFICAGAVGVLLTWPRWWSKWAPMLELGWIIPTTLIIVVLLMGLLLFGWRRMTGG